ncbi:MAG: hypothetical protein Q8P18_23500 [Pseudomonadota bacterium]|nr:hypothetical protein [Pseudomonadota bacterium]
MDPRLPERLEALLTRASEGDATDAERAELALVLDADAAWAPLRADLASTLGSSTLRSPAAPTVDLAGDVMAAIAAEAAWAGTAPSFAAALRAPAIDIADLVMSGISQEAEWAPIAASVRDAVRAPPIDIADPVMCGIDPDAELSAYFDGELPSDRTAGVAARLLRESGARDQLATFARLGEGLRGATHRGADVWPGVADAIGAERDAVHGWDAIAAPLREAFAAIPPIDVAGAVMGAVGPVGVRMPRWASLGGPLLGFAMAAALLFAVLPMSPQMSPSLAPSDGRPAAATPSSPDLRVATINDARVEEITAPPDVVVQVMQFEAGGPTFILVDDPSHGPGEGSGMGSGVPL